MGALDDRQRAEDIQPLPNSIKTALITESRQLLPYELVAMIAPDLGAVEIELPNLAEAAGKIYSVIVEDVDTADAGATTVATLVDNAGNTLFTLDADGDRALFYSDGFYWWPLVDLVA